MKLSVFLTVVGSFLTFLATAQNYSISGELSDKTTGEKLAFADVMLIQLRQVTQTDMDGAFAFNNVPSGTYTLVFRLMDYQTDTLEGVEVTTTPVLLSYRLGKPEEIVGVEIIGNPQKSQLSDDSKLTQEMKGSASAVDGMTGSSASTAGANAGQAAKRISGASITDNRFIVIRGLSDRYNAAYINGAPLPSSESDRKAFALDIFPSNMLENILINKTATPDMPGEFAGGVITINTKAPSPKNFQTIQIGTSFNTLTTFKDFQTYEGSGMDWAGVDNGARQLPDGLPDSKTYSTLNASEKAAYAKLMTPSWGIDNRKALPALNFQYGIGRNYQINKRDLGFVFAYTYQNTTSTNQTIRREFEEQATGVVQKSELNDTVYSQKYLNSALFNLAYELNDHNKITFNNLYSINSEDRVNIRHGVREMDSDPRQFEKSSNRWFTQNNLYSGQLEGNHEFRKDGMAFNWIGGFSNVVRTVPNMRRVVYMKSALTEDDTTTQYYAVIQNNGTIPTAAGNMFWSETRENIYSFKYDLSIPWEFDSISTVFKIGGFEQYRDRSFSARNFGFSKYKTSTINFDNSLLTLPEDEIFAPEHLGLQENGLGGFKLEEATKVSDSYNASSLLHAGFFMFDSKIRRKLRVVGGVRVESYNQRFSYTEAGTNIDRAIDTTVVDFLPSVNFIYSLNRNMNVRLSYSRTVSRPEFRELAPFAFYNFALDNILSGNPNLQRAIIDNFDLRYEYFMGAGQLFTVSGFYKHFTNPIELINRSGVSGAAELYYTNIPSVVNYGMEMEYRVKLDVFSKNKESKVWSNTTLYTNFALIRSQVDISEINGAIGDSRPLQGQSPYIINAGLQYEHPEKAWSVNASYNVIGRRIFIVGNIQEPDVWENSRHVIDLQFAKTFKEKFEVKLNLRDILAQDLLFYQDLNSNKKYDEGTDNRWQETNYGQTISISLNYKF